MPRIEELFVLHNAKSVGFRAHGKGEIAFVTNGIKRNGVLGYVRPAPKDKVFDFVGLVVSTFCEATVHIPPFIARGNGGSALMVLQPITPMSVAQLGFVAGFINRSLSWRFSWYRQATIDRIRRLEIPAPDESPVRFKLGDFLPGAKANRGNGSRCRYSAFPLNSIYRLEPGDYHSASALPKGETPLVSCGDGNNGIAGFVSVPEEHVYSDRLTIAFNGMNTLSTKFHPYKFATKDDVAICWPLSTLRPSTEIFIQMMMNRERWRYSFYRKCFMEKLERFSVMLPVRNGEPDEQAMADILTTSRYWPLLEQRLA